MTFDQQLKEFVETERDNKPAGRRERIATAFMAAQIQWIGVDAAIVGWEAIFEAADQFIDELDRKGGDGA